MRQSCLKQPRIVKSISKTATQHTTFCLMYMLEIWKNMIDKGRYVCAMFMGLSKAFGTMRHDSMIAKLGVYGFSQMLFST